MPLPVYIRPHKTLQVIGVTIPNVPLTNELIAYHTQQVIVNLNMQAANATENPAKTVYPYDLSQIEIPKVIN